MDTSNVINLGLMFVTAIGVLVAIYQAKQANEARRDAQAASEQAAVHKRAAVYAAELSAFEAGRSADAMEWQTAMAAREQRLRFYHAVLAYVDSDKGVPLELATAGAPDDLVLWAVRIPERFRSAKDDDEKQALQLELHAVLMDWLDTATFDPAQWPIT